MVEELFIGLLFLGAMAYIGRMIYRAFRAKTGCASGCAKCGAVDFAKIEKQIQEKGL